MIIGLTGTKGSGKSTVAEILKEKGYFYVSLSSILKTELEKRGIKNYTVKDLQDIGNEIRKNYGRGELIKRALIAAKGNNNIVIDGVRNLGEVQEIKKSGGILIAVDAPIKTRFERFVKRENNIKTLEEFKLLDQSDRRGKEEYGQQVDKCIENADYLIINNSDLEKLKEKIEEILKKESSKASVNMGEGITNYKRPSWDEYFMEVCKAIAKRATCDRGRSGCVIAKDNRILVTGYVGSPKGFPHCDDVGHLLKKVVHEDGKVSTHCVRTVHAEQNAICQAAKLGVSLDGATLYCKMTPCRTCAMLIINCGIKRVVCEKKYHLAKESEEMFERAGIELVYFDDEIESYENQ
ncbi:MAG: AAA family ATPase [Candidatus Aenigmarchaeota archaeon]|nr:AAA family ATPase [Candidatus Aenigmarchaeota archaeon]